MEILIILAMAYVFMKSGGLGLVLFGRRLAVFTMTMAFKYFKVVAILICIAVLYSYIESVL